MQETREYYEKQEERKKDLKVLFVLIPIILVVIFVLWLFRDYEKSVEKSYEGVLINADGSYEQNIIATVKGTITYESMFSYDIVSYYLGIKLEDNSDRVLLDIYSQASSINGSDYSFGSDDAVLSEFIQEGEKYTANFVGSMISDDELSYIVLELDDGRKFAAPAKTLEEAKNMIK